MFFETVHPRGWLKTQWFSSNCCHSILMQMTKSYDKWRPRPCGPVQLHRFATKGDSYDPITLHAPLGDISAKTRKPNYDEIVGILRCFCYWKAVTFKARPWIWLAYGSGGDLTRDESSRCDLRDHISLILTFDWPRWHSWGIRIDEKMGAVSSRLGVPRCATEIKQGQV